MNEIQEFRLMGAAQRGDREAFARLVAEHQQMACAVAYARTGSFAASEEIAQEAFLAAWKQLAVDPPRNFRAWLCGTIRHLAARFHRTAARFERLPEDLADEAPAPGDHVDAREEEALVWASLEQMAEIYREPLVLFYRQDRSTREVAAALGLSEGAVRQRLSRGRGLLREAVRARVESTLARSRPGAAFAVGVMATIPALTSTAQAAGTGLVVAKGGGAVLASGLSGVLGGFLIGAIGGWFGMKCSLERAESARERRLIVRTAAWIMGTNAIFMGALGALIFWGKPLLAERPAWWIGLMAVVILGFVGAMFFFAFRQGQAQIRVRAEERGRRGLNARKADPNFFEYRSRREFLGLPLVHIKLGSSALHVAKGWIAYGNIAVAPLLAFGGIAVGGVAMGGVSVGLLVTAGIGLGLVSFSGLALGGVVLGGLAIGWIALGGAALGGLAAFGGAGWAGTYALGKNVAAPHANDAAAKAFFSDHGLTQAFGWFADHGMWIQLGVFLPILAVSLLVQRLRRRARAGEE